MVCRALSGNSTFAAALGCMLAFTPFLAVCGRAQSPDIPANQRYAGSGTLRHHTPPQVLDGTAQRIDHYRGDHMLRLALAIQPPHMAEEEAFLAELNTKGSPNFHNFLTPEEWNARFAPSVADEQKVVNWAQSHGLKVTQRFSHRLIVAVEGPVNAIEKAFGVTINNYQVGDEVDFANDGDPVLPAELQGVLYSVQGMNSIQRDRPQREESNHVKGADYSPGEPHHLKGSDKADGDPSKMPASLSSALNGSPLVANGSQSNQANPTPGYMAPTDIYNSQEYNYAGLQALGHCCNPHNDSGGSPNVSSIAIAAFGDFLGSDVVGFQKGYPYLAFNYTAYNVNGSIDCTNPKNSGACPSGETSQDLQWSLATANSFGSSNDTAHVYVYIGANGNNDTFTMMYSQMLDDNTARVMTTSWSCTEVYGCSDSVMDSRHSIFNSMVGQGWTLIAASGDRGSADDCSYNKTTKMNNTAHFSVAYPASDYDVVAAGGTEMSIYIGPIWMSEVAWSGGMSTGSCGSNNGGSGGGVSSYYGKPGWQSSLGGNGNKRLSPDLALNADGVGQNVYVNGSWGGSANGTSVSAPELAGFFAQENSYLNAIGHVCGNGTAACTPVGNPMPYVYAAGVYNDNAHNPFYDITSGCNSNDATQQFGLGFYCAGAGYDQVTGWGSANMMQLAWAINWQLIPANGVPNVSFTGPATNHWYNSNQTVSWKVNDYSGGAYPGTGIAGFTQGWDSIPNDSAKEAHGGAGDSFYSGPQFPNVNTGCLAFQNNGCSGGVSQGCHTAHVRGWNNQGQTTGNATYGPVCFDTVAPTVTITNNPKVPASGFYPGWLTVSLAANDAGGNGASGIKNTYYSIDAYTCYPQNLAGCTVYNGAFPVYTTGYHYVYYMTEDNAGNFSPVETEEIAIDFTPPLTVANLGGGQINGTYSTVVNVALSAGDNLSGVAKTLYTVDGGAQQTYGTSYFTVAALGAHTIKYWSVDKAGNVETMHTLTFTILSPTTATVTGSPQTAMKGQAVTLTATVKATISGTPTGMVTFYTGSTNLGTKTLVNGVASLTTVALPEGMQTLQVSYLGAGNFRATNSAPFNETVH